VPGEHAVSAVRVHRAVTHFRQANLTWGVASDGTSVYCDVVSRANQPASVLRRAVKALPWRHRVLVAALGAPNRANLANAKCEEYATRKSAS
jgi:hypothetical protein